MESKKKVVIPDNIFKLIAEGDQWAFEELYKLTFKPIFAFCLSLTMNREDAEDLMQETYIKTRNGAHLFKGGNAMAWMMKIAKNIFLMEKRKATLQIVSLTEADDGKQAIGLTFDDISNVENRILIEELFTNISDWDRNIIIMHALMGMKFREISEELGLPEGTVKTRYHRAAEQLRQCERKMREEII